MTNKRLTKRELASLMSVFINKVDRDMLKGLPYKKLGNAVRFNIREVQDYYGVKLLDELTTEELKITLEVLTKVYKEIKQKEN
jgi:hypothetical protein